MDSYVKTVTVSDPGVSLVIGGQTSYDKYKAGNVSGANSHANTLIEGVKVSTNLDLSIIDSYSATLDGANLGAGTISSGTSVVASYGNLTRTQYKTYLCKAEMTVGPVTFTSERDFHITGLPYEADFTSSNPTGWTPAWGMISTTYKSNKVVFQGTSGVRSPGFYIPESSIKVVTSCDCRHNVTDNSRSMTMNIASCSSTESSLKTDKTLTLGSDYYQAKGTFGNVSGFDSKGYLKCSSSFELTSAKPSLIYSVSLGTSILGSNTCVSFKHKIEYSE